MCQNFCIITLRQLKSAIITILAGFICVFAACTLSFARPGAKANILARVALLGDSHLNLATNGNQAAFEPHFRKAIAQVNAAGVDFVLIAGDLTQSGKPEEYADFKANIKSFFAPVWFVPGNHDVGDKFNSGKGEKTTVTRARVGRYEKNVGPSWFSTNCAGVRIIGINSSILGSGFELEKQMWEFLESELCTPARVPTLLFMHYPLFVKNQDEPGGEYWNIEPAPRARLYSLLKKGGVKIVLNGHLHHPLVNRRDGILFVTTPPTSFGLPAGKQPEGWTLITIFKNGTAIETFQFIESSKVSDQSVGRNYEQLSVSF
jgi:3',5'-cyclic AMP phosphodiesterase CpdA